MTARPGFHRDYAASQAFAGGTRPPATSPRRPPPLTSAQRFAIENALRICDEALRHVQAIDALLEASGELGISRRVTVAEYSLNLFHVAALERLHSET